MPARDSHDLHGNAPDQCDVVLVLIDVITDFAFPTGAQLLPRAAKAAQKLAELKARARRAGVPCVYANDNHGRWRSDFRALVAHCGREQSRGQGIAALLHPTREDYFVLKPKHSAFYKTCMSTLLEHLGAKTLIMAGFATHSCVMFSATDAFLRGYQLLVPRDGVASDDLAGHRSALSQMQRGLRARTPRCEEISFVCSGRRVSLRVRAS